MSRADLRPVGGSLATGGSVAIDGTARPGLRLAFAASLLTVTLVQFLVYLRLPNRSSWLSRTQEADVRATPRPDFRLGLIEFPVSWYATSQELEPFRQEFDRHCAGRRGLLAAICLSDALAFQFPHGSPPAEFVDREFDPIAHLRRHMGGTPGHCLNRSAIITAELLSVGIPARVTQLLPQEGRGHTLVEVWDDRFQWVVVDPTVGAVAGEGQEPKSALDLMSRPGQARWVTLTVSPSPPLLLAVDRKLGPERRLYGGSLVYPEPWLYLRAGKKHAPWPFRGSFAYYGGNALLFGAGHNILRMGIVGCVVGGLAAACSAFRMRRNGPWCSSRSLNS